MAKSLIFCVALLAGLGLARVARAGESAAAMIAESQAALDKGDAGEARRLADAALKDGASGGERAQLLLSRGLALELLGSHDGALADLTAAIDSRALARDDRAQALLQRGFLLDGLGKLDAAARDYGAVIALKTAQAATALNNRANIWRRQDKLAEARRDYLAALDAGSARPQYPYYGLGQIAEAQHDKETARGFYAKAVAADPGYHLASERLAELGGAPDAALAEPDAIHLRQPLPGTEPAARPDPSRPDRTPIVLKPPRASRPIPARSVLKPPQAARPAPLGLRPALDASAPGGAEVQLGAWRSEAEARAGWTRAQARAGGLLDGLRPHIVTTDLPGKGRYYRLRTAPARGQARGRFCAALAGQGLACLPARD